MPNISQQGDSNIGSATEAEAQSASQVLSTLAPVSIYAGIFLLIFLIVRRWFPRVYSPRSFLGSLRPQERSPQLSNGWFDWLRQFFSISDFQVLNSNSLDAFLFLRSLKIYVVCCIVGCVLTWPILFPVNASGPGGQKQLSILTMANAINEDQPNSYYRYYAHTFCAWLFFPFLLYMITRESIYYINLRQAYLVSPLYADRVSSKTVLFTSVPDAYLNEKVLREMLGENIVRIWIPRNTKDLEDAVEERDKLAHKLENAEAKLIKAANKARVKAAGSKKNSGPAASPDEDEIQLRDLTRSGSVAAQWLDPKDRPTHRLKFLIGRKVDTIEWCRAELAKKIPEIEEMQRKWRNGEGKNVNSVFVQYSSLREAQSAFQSLTHHQPLHMAPRYTGMVPEEIIWANLRIKWWERVIRFLSTTAAVVALIILWSFPVAFVGAISQITYLTGLPGLHWLDFLNRLPNWLSGVVTGLLPSVMLALLFTVLPIFLRLMASIGGEPTLSGVEYTVQNTYFAFQVIQVFLVTTLSSGITTAIKGFIDNPASILQILATSLPKASNFYLSYIIVQGLGVVGQVLLGLTGLVLFVLLGKLLDGTPRKKFIRWTQLASQSMGTVYPIYTNLFVIAICYTCIAPLVAAFAAIGLYFFYLAYRYNFLFVWGVESDTKGLMYARSLQQLFVGIYLAQLCMIGLFAIGVGNSKGALGPLILMIILIVITALYHMSLNAALNPLLRYLPKTLETEERRLLALEEMDQAAEEDVEKDRTLGHSDTFQTAASSSGRFDKALPDLPNNPAPFKDTLTKGDIGAWRTWFIKWLRPDVYADYYAMRKLVPRHFATVRYDDEEERDAYLHPSIKSEPPLLWVPRDPAGVSTQEVRDTGKIINITDEGATLTDKNDIVWDEEHASKAPIYEKPVFY
ncbi:hypothetical protein FH972_026599 [Carpinus fangiana]|uniref:CSC1/OSCA1-like 7TM region domain-containing protein n=1 Tax=Carpinus fangiana TaxID=176857 RepID=A0A5N6L4X1_9ROSI|nr:hypothetical protein FH972_026599 [Carpinus fangiana]